MEESYFNSEKLYCMKNFKNFPFVKYIYTNKKQNINTEEYSRISKDIEKKRKLDEFLKKLRTEKNNILFSNNVTREAGYFSKNNSYRKIISRNNNQNHKIYSYCKTDYRKGNNNYDLDVCFLKHINFSQNKKF